MHLLVEIRCRQGTHMDRRPEQTQQQREGGGKEIQCCQLFMFMFMRHVHEAVFMKPMCMKPLWPHDGGQTF